MKNEKMDRIKQLVKISHKLAVPIRKGFLIYRNYCPKCGKRLDKHTEKYNFGDFLGTVFGKIIYYPCQCGYEYAKKKSEWLAY